MKKEEKYSNSKNDRVVMKGIPLSPGLAIGTIYFYQNAVFFEIENARIERSEVQNEIKRFQSALAETIKETTELKKQVTIEVKKDKAAIFEAYILTLHDETLIQEIENHIRSKLVNAESAIREVFMNKEDALQQSDNPLLIQRTEDFRDLRNYLLKNLISYTIQEIEISKSPLIVVARKILPSDIINFNVKNVYGIITAEGGINAHTAILAREYSLPYVSNISIDRKKVAPGTTAIIDGEQGRVILNPKPEEIDNIRQKREKREQIFDKSVACTKNKILLLNNEPVRIFANTFVPTDVKVAERVGVEGIGLFRIESLYMSMHRLPTEQELYQMLSHSLEPMRSLPITVRLLDIGGNKSLPYVPQTQGTKSLLGLRGIHFLQKYPDLFRVQVRALLRLSEEFDISILVPMVTTVSDMIETRNFIKSEQDSMQRSDSKISPKEIPLGSMIETPAALLTFDEILRYSNFVSLGTNDLIQYIMVADREDSDMESYYENGTKIVVKQLKPLIHKCKDSRKPCTLCGELTVDKRFTEKLLSAGLRRFSAIPYYIPELKQHIAKIIAKKP